MDGAGAALRNAAPELGARQAQQVPQDPQPRHLSGSVDVLEFTINLQIDHAVPRSWTKRSAKTRHACIATTALHLKISMAADRRIGHSCGTFCGCALPRRFDISHSATIVGTKAQSDTPIAP